MFSEVIDSILGLFDAPESFTYHSKRYNVDSAKLRDPPEPRVPIGISVSRRDSCRLAGEKGDIMIATEPMPELDEMFDEDGGKGKLRIGQRAVAYDAGRDRAVERARPVRLVRAWLEGQQRPAGSPSFGAATAFVAPEQGGEQLPCGPDVEERVSETKPFVDAGYDEVALVQIGVDQQKLYFEWAEKELLPALRQLHGGRGARAPDVAANSRGSAGRCDRASACSTSRPSPTSREIPGDHLSTAPLAWPTLVAAILMAVGLLGFGRRDVL